MACHHRVARAVRAQHIVLGDLRADGQHDDLVDRHQYRPHDRFVRMDCADSHHVVSGVQSVHDFRFHAVRHYAVEAAGRAPDRAVDHYQNGAPLLWADRGPASSLWVLGSIAIITVGELYLSPVGLSLVTKVAPARILSMMMGVWLATSFTGGFLAGWLGSFWSRMEKPHFFLMIAAISALAGVVIFLCRWPLRGALRE